MSSRDAGPIGQVYLTGDGLARMKEELEHLRTVRRGEVAELIRRAKEVGDITDSAQYEAAKDEQAFLEGRIRILEETIARAVVIEGAGAADGAVRLGSTVRLVDGEGVEEAWTIVGRAEANAAMSRISNESPVGRALLGRRAGEVVEVETPGGPLRLSVLSVD